MGVNVFILVVGATMATALALFVFLVFVTIAATVAATTARATPATPTHGAHGGLGRGLWLRRDSPVAEAAIFVAARHVPLVVAGGVGVVERTVEDIAVTIVSLRIRRAG